VVLVDGDLRNPEVDRFFAVPGTVGLTSVLRGEAGLADAARQWRADLPLYLLPVGPPAGDQGEKLIRSPELADVLESFRLGSALVIIDAPPLLSDAEALSLMERSDATVLVGRVGVTRTEHFTAAVEVARVKGIKLLGVVATR
jgi:Mrp family chromosome partitioning ATPase